MFGFKREAGLRLVESQWEELFQGEQRGRGKTGVGSLGHSESNFNNSQQ